MSKWSDFFSRLFAVSLLVVSFALPLRVDFMCDAFNLLPCFVTNLMAAYFMCRRECVCPECLTIERCSRGWNQENVLFRCVCARSAHCMAFYMASELLSDEDDDDGVQFIRLFIVYLDFYGQTFTGHMSSSCSIYIYFHVYVLGVW